MRTPGEGPRKLRNAPKAREDLRERLDRYLDLPLALASILLVLIAIMELTGEVSEPWRGRAGKVIKALGTKRFLLFLLAISLTTAGCRGTPGPLCGRFW